MNPASVSVRQLSPAEAQAKIPELCAVLADCVAGGASVSFLAPLAPQSAEAFWRGVADGVARAERVLIVAEDLTSGEVVGTVQVVFCQTENQPHRGELAKMLVHRRARRSGVGAALMGAAEDAARAAGRTLLVLDTASAEAERLYARAGWTRVGVVPGFALLPNGTPCDTTYFFKELTASPGAEAGR